MRFHLNRSTSCGLGAVVFLILETCQPTSSWAQEKKEEVKEEGKRVLIVGQWYPTLESGLKLTQSSYTANWEGGDMGSVVWTLIANGSLENQLHQKMNWLNTVKLAYGQTHQEQVDDAGNRGWDRPSKSTDMIDFETIARFTLGGFVDPFAAFRFESQFQGPPDPSGRTIAFNPMTFKESAGIARKFIDEKERSLLSRLGFTFRQSSRRYYKEIAPSKATALESSNDGGFEWVTDYKTRILQDRLGWASKLGVYQPVFYSGKDDLESLTPEELEAAQLDPDIADFSTTVDFDWENIFTTQVTKLISVELYTRWVYDKYDNSIKPLFTEEDGTMTLLNPEAVGAAVRKAGQFKQTLGVGITYRFL